MFYEQIKKVIKLSEWNIIIGVKIIIDNKYCPHLNYYTEYKADCYNIKNKNKICNEINCPIKVRKYTKISYSKCFLTSNAFYKDIVKFKCDCCNQTYRLDTIDYNCNGVICCKCIEFLKLYNNYIEYINEYIHLIYKYPTMKRKWIYIKSIAIFEFRILRIRQWIERTIKEENNDL